MIELKNVCYAYGNEIALRYINLNIQKGESVIIQGPNGCGKSTLIKILNGIIFPMEGSYTYENHEITEKALKDSRFAKWFHQQIGYVFQNADTQLFCGSVEEEIAFGPTQMGLSEGEIKQRTDDCLKLFGIEKLRERPPYNLSGGEKRKVSLACILSMNPEVLILDEPLAGLDESTQKMLIDFLKKFHAAGKTLIIITHNNQLAKKLGITYYDKNIISEIAEKSGLSPEYIQESAELSPKKGLFAYALAGRDITGKSVEDMVYEAQRKVILELAEKESCVIIGRNADFILRDWNDVLNVFIHGDIPEKMQRIMGLYNVEEKEAVKMMADTDKRRMTNYNFYTDQKWGKASNYTLSLNSSQLGYDRCEAIVMECVK